MITDHGGVNRSATELVAKLHVTPESNPTSESLKSGGERNLASLRKLNGACVRQAYVDHRSRLPSGRARRSRHDADPERKENAELKALLVKVRPAFVAHLGTAKMLQRRWARAADEWAPPRPVSQAVPPLLGRLLAIAGPALRAHGRC